jgi:Beta-lactamase associated winged helix domain
LLAHRQHRENQILAALEAGPRSIPSIVAELYADVRPELHEAAGRSVLAHLLDLTTRDLVHSEAANAADPPLWGVTSTRGRLGG